MHEAELRRLPHGQQERLLHRNRKAGSAARNVVHRSSFQIVDAVPLGLNTVRCRDKARTQDGAAYTAEVNMERTPRIGPVYVLNVVRGSMPSFTMTKGLLSSWRGPRALAII